MTKTRILLGTVCVLIALGGCAQKPMRNLAPASEESLLKIRGSDGEIADGIRALLRESAARATRYLSSPAAWDRRDATRIPTPASAESIVAALRVYGYGRLWDPVMMDINRGMERSAQQAMPLFESAIARLEISDVRAIMTGGDDAATKLLCTQERENLVREYATVLKRGLAEAGYFTSVGIMVKNYNEVPVYADIVAPDVEPELRERGIDGICMHMAEQEMRMRNLPDTRPDGAVQQLLSRPW